MVTRMQSGNAYSYISGVPPTRPWENFLKHHFTQFLSLKASIVKLLSLKASFRRVLSLKASYHNVAIS